MMSVPFDESASECTGVGSSKQGSPSTNFGSKSQVIVFGTATSIGRLGLLKIAATSAETKQKCPLPREDIKSEVKQRNGARDDFTTIILFCEVKRSFEHISEL